MIKAPLTRAYESRQWPLIHGCLIMNALLPALVLSSVVLPSACLAGHGAAHIKNRLV
jgi:hypothetical protein